MVLSYFRCIPTIETSKSYIAFVLIEILLLLVNNDYYSAHETRNTPKFNLFFFV